MSSLSVLPAFRFVSLAAVLVTCAAGCGQSNLTELKGSGASFPDPIYQRWFADFSQANKDVRVEYTAKGSGKGIKDFQDGHTDFGASDAAMTDDQMAAIPEGVQLIPLTAGAVVVCYNVADAEGKPIEGLKLSREAYVGIFLGEITKWNDPAIAASNEGLALPDKAISLVYRSDSSGTTYVFTQHLAAVSEKFNEQVGLSMSPKWPVGSGSDKNSGVANSVKQNDGTIGYVEFGYAEQNDIKMAVLENKAGKYTVCTPESSTAALASITDFPEDLRVWVPDPEGEDSYPIVTFTWVLLRKTYPDAEKVAAMKELFTYCLTDGQSIATELGYVPLPKNVVDKGLAALENVTAKAATATASVAGE
jgi:phosphate transport system substrate-binding protein